MTITNLTLPPDLAAFVEQQVESGDFETHNEVIREALRLLRERAKIRALRLQELREEIRPALEQLDRGEGKPLDIEDIIARGRERLSQQNRSE